MSALVILECNACGAITPPWPTPDRVREEVAPEGWAVDVDGSNVDYCPQCTAPADAPGAELLDAAARQAGPSRLDIARHGVVQLRDALASIAHNAGTVTPQAMQSVASLALLRANQLIAEMSE